MTGGGPVENRAPHVGVDPIGTNHLSLAMIVRFTPSPAAMFAASGSVSNKLTAWYGP